MDELVQTLLPRIPDGGIILHLACGDGALLAAVASSRPDLRLLGYDRAPARIRAARARNLPRATFAVFDLQLDRPPPAAGRVDAAVTTSVLRILEKPARLFLHLRRLLRPGAPLLIIEPQGLSERHAQQLAAWGLRVEALHGNAALTTSPGIPEGGIRGWE